MKIPGAMRECELVRDQYSGLLNSASTTLLSGRRPIELLSIFGHGKLIVVTEAPKPWLSHKVCCIIYFNS